MQITKRQAMSLVKVLSHYGSMTSVGNQYPVIDNVNLLIEELEEYVLESDGVKTFSDTFKIDGDVDPGIMIGLQPIRGHVNNSSYGEPGDDVEIRFKRVIKEGNEIDTFLCVNKEMIGPITYVRMSDREIQISVGEGFDRYWHYFDAETLPQSWVNVFGTNGMTLRVISWE